MFPGLPRACPPSPHVIAPGIPGRRKNIQLPDATAAWDFIITSQPVFPICKMGKLLASSGASCSLTQGTVGRPPDPRSQQAETRCWTSGPPS